MNHEPLIIDNNILTFLKVSLLTKKDKKNQQLFYYINRSTLAMEINTPLSQCLRLSDNTLAHVREPAYRFAKCMPFDKLQLPMTELSDNLMEAVR